MGFVANGFSWQALTQVNKGLAYILRVNYGLMDELQRPFATPQTLLFYPAKTAKPATFQELLMLRAFEWRR